MPLTQWEDSYLLGTEEIDQHHQHLVMLLNAAFDQFQERHSRESFSALLAELEAYATYHFNFEESCMEKSTYPKLPEHKKAHQFYTVRIREIQKEFNSCDNELTVEVLSFMHSWIIDHILRTDAEFGRFLLAAKN